MDGKSTFGKAKRFALAVAITACAAGSVRAQSAEAAAAEEKFSQPTEQPARFTPGTLRFLAGATLEMRGEATIVGGDVKLGQICRWSQNDKAAFETVADLTVARIGGGTAFRAITVKELKSVLSDAGVNMAVVRFAGATHCTVTRSDATSDERASLQDWVNAREGTGAATQPTSLVVASMPQPQLPVAQTASLIQSPAKAESKTLRDLLIADLAERLQLEPANIQLAFIASDEKILRLAEPIFHFNVDGQRIHNLGDVTWEVTILAEGGKVTSQKTMIKAKAKVWEEQLVTRIPLGYHQEFRESDIFERRELVDHVEPDPAMKRDQVVGQQSSRELRAGTILTSRLVEATPMARIGELLTVTIAQGNVQITTVARATENGNYGQTIRARHEGDNAMYDVTLTGPKAGRVQPIAAAPERATATVAE